MKLPTLSFEVAETCCILLHVTVCIVHRNSCCPCEESLWLHMRITDITKHIYTTLCCMSFVCSLIMPGPSCMWCSNPQLEPKNVALLSAKNIWLVEHCWKTKLTTANMPIKQMIIIQTLVYFVSTVNYTLGSAVTDVWKQGLKYIVWSWIFAQQIVGNQS